MGLESSHEPVADSLHSEHSGPLFPSVDDAAVKLRALCTLGKYLLMSPYS